MTPSSFDQHRRSQELNAFMTPSFFNQHRLYQERIDDPKSSPTQKIPLDSRSGSVLLMMIHIALAFGNFVLSLILPQKHPLLHHYHRMFWKIIYHTGSHLLIGRIMPIEMHHSWLYQIASFFYPDIDIYPEIPLSTSPHLIIKNIHRPQTVLPPLRDHYLKTIHFENTVASFHDMSHLDTLSELYFLESIHQSPIHLAPNLKTFCYIQSMSLFHESNHIIPPIDTPNNRITTNMAPFQFRAFAYEASTQYKAKKQKLLIDSNPTTTLLIEKNSLPQDLEKIWIYAYEFELPVAEIFSHSNLNTIILGYHPFVKEITVRNPQLKTLSLRSLPLLQSIVIENIELHSLMISDCPALEAIIFTEASTVIMEVTTCPLLKKIIVPQKSQQELTTLSVRNCPNVLTLPISVQFLSRLHLWDLHPFAMKRYLPKLIQLSEKKDFDLILRSTDLLNSTLQSLMNSARILSPTIHPHSLITLLKQQYDIFTSTKDSLILLEALEKIQQTILQYPHIIDAIESISSIYLAGCVNQARYGLCEIMAWIHLYEHSRNQAQIQGRELLIAVKCCISWAQKQKDEPGILEAELALSMLSLLSLVNPIFQKKISGIPSQLRELQVLGSLPISAIAELNDIMAHFSDQDFELIFSVSEHLKIVAQLFFREDLEKFLKWSDELTEKYEKLREELIGHQNTQSSTFYPAVSLVDDMAIDCECSALTEMKLFEIQKRNYEKKEKLVFEGIAKKTHALIYGSQKNSDHAAVSIPKQPVAYLLSQNRQEENTFFPEKTLFRNESRL